MPISVRSAALLLPLLVQSACYTTYTAVSFGNRDHALNAETRSAIERELREFMKTCCMEPIDAVPFLAWSVHRPCATRVVSLVGSNAHVTLAVDLDDLSVTLRDFDHTTRTDFIAYLELHLTEIFERHAGHHLSFKRQLEGLVPNS
ncbi:MAG TPA: hypothetical protein VII72_05265 [Myxococcota bacterium]|jgi:hypothetical protein